MAHDARSYVFAYGSNMHLADLRRWLLAHDYRQDLVKSAAPARLQGYRLVWNYFSKARGGAAANVEKHPSSQLYGVVLEVGSEGLQAIDDKEGHPQRYHRGSTPQEVTLLDGGSQHAWLYQVLPAFVRTEPIWPTPSYLALMIEGAVQHGLPDHYVAQLRKMTTQSEPTP